MSIKPLKPENYTFVRLWDGSTAGTKGAFVDKENGYIYPVNVSGNRYHFYFYNLAKIREMGFRIVGGKARTAFLKQFGLVVDNDNKTIRMRK